MSSWAMFEDGYDGNDDLMAYNLTAIKSGVAPAVITIMMNGRDACALGAGYYRKISAWRRKIFYQASRKCHVWGGSGRVLQSGRSVSQNFE